MGEDNVKNKAATTIIIIIITIRIMIKTIYIYIISIRMGAETSECPSFWEDSNIKF